MGCTWDNGGVANIACLNILFANLIRALVMLAGVALFIMLLIGGFKYLTSGGDAKKAESGRSTIMWAIIGLVVMISSYAIIRAIEMFTGVTGLLEFRIPTF